MQFEIKVDAKPAIEHLDAVAKKQLPFAYSLSLNRASEKARDKFVSDTLPSAFTLRTGWWKPRNRWGFNIKPSTKHTLVTSIYTKAPWMEDHEKGGIRTPKKKSFAVPHANVKRSKRGLISRSNKPAGMKNKFVKEVNGQPLLFRRLKKSIRLMYNLVPSARIRPALKFKDTISKEVNRIYQDEFNKAFNEAMRSAK